MQGTELLMFIAQHPFKEINLEFGPTQIIKIDYAAQEVTLRDFCEYTLLEIMQSDGFRDVEIQLRWLELIQPYCAPQQLSLDEKL